MKKNTVIKETLTKYEGYKIKDIELISTIIGERAGLHLYNSGLTNLDEINSYGLKDLIKLTGISKDKAIQLLALYELCKRNIKDSNIQSISSPNDIFSVCKDMMYESQEVLRLICLDTKNNIILSKDMFKGGLNTSIVDIKIILKEALRFPASSIVLVHNHPSGNPEPSKEDIDLTNRLFNSCKLIGINLLDHIIIGYDKYTSFKEKCLV